MNILNWVAFGVDALALIFCALAVWALVRAARYTRETYHHLARLALATAKTWELAGEPSRASDSRRDATRYVRLSLPLLRRSDTRVVQELSAAIAEAHTITTP